jgi:hypothetical protein
LSRQDIWFYWWFCSSTARFWQQVSDKDINPKVWKSGRCVVVKKRTVVAMKNMHMIIRQLP